MKTWTLLILFLPSLTMADESAHHSEAKRLRDLSVQAREAHDHQKALEYAKEAMEFSDSPNLHYNLGLVLEDLGRNAEALTEFKRFLESPGGDPSARPDAIQKIETLNLKRREAEMTSASLTLSVPPLKRRSFVVPVVTGAGALVLTAIGAGLLGSAESDYHALQGTCQSRLCTVNDWSGSQRMGNAGIALLAIGGAAVAADVVLWIVGAKKGWVF